MYFPCQISVFQHPIHFLLSLFCQVLGLDDDSLVSEVMIGYLVHASHSKNSKSLNLDEFLDEKIHSQLEKFHLEQNFIYQTLLLKMIVHENQISLQDIKLDIFIRDLSFLLEAIDFSFLKFFNEIMATAYQLFYDSNLPRVSDEIRSKMKITNDHVADWFLYK